jgi:hypothetical protein
MKKQDGTTRILLGIGLLLNSTAALVKDYLPVPDFFRGFMAGLGLGLMIFGLIRMRNSRRSEKAC